MHVDDLADACLFLIENYDGDEHINVGTGEDLSIRELAELVRDVVSPGLAISFDDGFICYLNGKEVARANVKSGALGAARGVEPHETKGFKCFPLPDAKNLLKPGKNMIALEIHNDDLGSSDLTLDPYLILSDEAVPEGGKDDPSSDD